ncbi:MAG: hypothetical protein J0M05_15135 [Candidatus Kapabacteria bacterium]|nr:hypothetical protein [Candidatus Kapabacteria bacterium]
MNEKIREIQERRFQFLHKLYELSEGNDLFSIDAFELGNQLGYSHDETNRIDNYLRGEFLVEGVAGTRISITHHGIVEVETALSKPNEPTTYFPPVNYIHVEQMIGSQIQQGTNQSSQVLTYTNNDIEAILKFVTDLKKQIPELKLNAEIKAEVESDISTIESQAKSPRPKPTIIKECLLSIKTILEGIAGNVIAAMLMQQISVLLK